jgi:GNAT superfamily N-acetyltransferase
MTEGIIAFTKFDAGLRRDGFDCGNAALNTWFKEQAGQQEKRDSVRTHLGLATFDCCIASFFSLVTHRIEVVDAAQSATFSSRRYPIPAVLIAQLAVDLRYQGQGVGKLTLGHALGLLAESSKSVGFEVVLVDAIDDGAAAFYRKYGFKDLVDGGERLYLSTKDLRRSFEESAE